jgi:uncharacterized protein (TIGR04255 family)
VNAMLPAQRRREPLPNHQLGLVVGQVRFPRLPRFAENGYTLPFEDVMRTNFPKASREPSVSLVVKDNEVTTETGEMLLRFTDLDNRYTVVLAPDFIALECRFYDSFEKFSTHFMIVVELAGEIFDIKHRLRLGLRYINEMRWSRARTYMDWQRFLNSDYMGWNPLEKLGGTILHTIAEFAAKREDGVFRLRRGFLSGSTIPQPGRSRHAEPNEFYLIDLDYSDDTPAALMDDLPDRLRRYHDFIEEIFFQMTEHPELQAYLNEPRP